MKKIYLSPSDQTKNTYKVGNTNEATQCRAIADLCVVALKRCGFDAKTNNTANMWARVRESNSWGADAHIPIHTNAYDGNVKGFRGFFYKAGNAGHKLCEAIKNTVAPITPGNSDGLSAQPGLYEVKASNAPCAYLELGFHDNAEEAKYIIDHKADLAEAICKGVCNHFGVKYIAPGSTAEVKHSNEYSLTQFIKDVQKACGAVVDGIAGNETISKTVTLSARKNRTHAAVKAVQKRLYALGYEEVGKADGIAGQKFTVAVVEFQEDNRCWVDGEITAGCKTWKKLLGME